MVQVLESLFTGKFGGVAVMLLISGAVIFFLRALYGPRGMFRDPMWNKSNQCFRMHETEERELNLKDYLKKGESDNG